MFYDIDFDCDSGMLQTKPDSRLLEYAKRHMTTLATEAPAPATPFPMTQPPVAMDNGTMMGGKTPEGDNESRWHYM